MDKAIQVKSEIGQLRQVLVHRPGAELSGVIPDARADLLFDDTPHLAMAQKEHDAFVEVLREQGVTVFYTADLAARALESRGDVKAKFVSELIDESGVFVGRYKEALSEYFMGLGEDELIEKAACGVSLTDVGFGLFGAGLSRLKSPESQFITRPMPNLYFARDPMATIGNGVAISHMRYPARNRETIFTKFIFEHHPDFKGKTKFYYKKHWPFSLEGGDILNLSANVVAVGISQRTYPAAIDALAQVIFSDAEAEINTILAFEIPKQHNCMHLDTIFTNVDHGKFLIYENIMLNLPSAYVLRRREAGEFSVEVSPLPLAQLLAKELELDNVKLIPCGGNAAATAAREQWNAAANTLAIAPGVVICYNRNDITNKILRENGVEVLEIPSSELSRGRGGPRCMSMPLIRD
ncbi:MAG: arginine deiminase [Clostridiales bacterium]|nr:arginine deiminase [Clostridiales bacterium]